MSYFIRNTGDQSLSKIINNLLPSKTKSLDFLVGYFYFSGMEEIYSNLEDKPMRILVGLDMDHDILKKTSEYDFYVSQRRSSSKEIRDEYFKSFVDLFNTTDYFESNKQAQAFKIYYEKIKNGTLEIRKTLDPCHAKLYIFEYKDELKEDGETPGTVITGSSNFTYSGFQSNNEVNVRFHSAAEFQSAQQIFDELWESASVLVDKDHIAEFEQKVKTQIWLDNPPTPYLLYLRVLYEYFNLDSSARVLTPFEITNGNFSNLKYQEDAVRMALNTIKTHNGVIVADVVGLGKSIIGSTVARNLDLRTIIIAPPHLVDQWKSYAYDFQVQALVYSRGNLEKVLDEYRNTYREGEQRLIIIDEAHYYRNEFTRDYAILHEICQGNKVMLLTATPFNNRPEDIYAMIKLFQVPSKSTLQTVKNLGGEFGHWIAQYKKLKTDQRKKKKSKKEIETGITGIGNNIRRIIEPLVIRRSRLDLKNIPAYLEDLQIQGIQFPEVMPPEEKVYDLGELKDLYVYTLERICPKDTDVENADNYVNDDIEYADEPVELGDGKKFVAARYQPIVFYKNEHFKEIVQIIKDAGFDENLFLTSQKNLASFMRTLLVRRFESSQHAFKMSLDNMLIACQKIKRWIDKRGTVPVFKKGNLPDVADYYNSTADGSLQLFSNELENMIDSLQSKGMFEIPVHYLEQQFFDALDSDIRILEDLKRRWDKIPESNDPKLSGFIRILSEQLKRDPDRKIVVFSQFADTVDYLGERLIAAGLPVFQYTSKFANDKNKRIIMQNFDAGIKQENQKDDYKILVATDAISEGYNLHRAGTIFNYDIPYNPTRVIQRVGRINRVNKKVFDELYIFNYFPTAIGEDETRTREISTMKMAMIHAIMGEDTRYLTKEEELNSYFAQKYNEAMSESETESWDTPYRARLHQLINSEAMKKALALPQRSKVHRLTTFRDSGIIAFAQRGNDYIFRMAKNDQDISTLDPRDAFAIFEAQEGEPGYDISTGFNALFGKLKENMFVHESIQGESDKSKREAMDKVRYAIQNRLLDSEYLEDLRKAIQYDAIAGYSLREINRLKVSELSKMPEKVSPQYVRDVLRNIDAISRGVEVVIAAEEIQNINTDPQTEISL